ncbi:hypothetical protein YQE_04174, partial [Dendroctonus ponderosae]
MHSMLTVSSQRNDAAAQHLNNRHSECQLQDHIIVDSPERMNEILSAFGTINSNDTFPLSHSTNTTFTSFYGSHDVLSHQTTSA